MKIPENVTIYIGGKKYTKVIPDEVVPPELLEKFGKKPAETEAKKAKK